MTSALTTLPAGAVPAAFAGFAGPNMNAAAQQGLLPSFAVIGFKGSNWRLKYRGDEILVKDARGLPEQALDVVIVGISPNISKQWYEKKFTEGDDTAPDCFSINGIHPDPASPKKQCDTCAVCPQNLWGSRITEAGKKAKNCQDSRRLAVVPSADILNADFGGPMMLRLPPTSLAGLAAFAKELNRFGAQPFMVKCQLSFDTSVAYPLINFKATGWITEDEQAEQIKQVLADPQIERMLQEEVTEATHDPAVSSPLMQGKPSGVLAEAAAKVQTPVPEPVVSAPSVPETPPAASSAAAQPPATAPAVAAKKTSPFGASAAPPPATTTVATPETTQAATQVQQAPSDLNSMIDDLLKG